MNALLKLVNNPPAVGQSATALHAHFQLALKSEPNWRQLCQNDMRVILPALPLASVASDTYTRTRVACSVHADPTGALYNSYLDLLAWAPGARVGWHGHRGAHGTFLAVSGEVRELVRSPCGRVGAFTHTHTPHSHPVFGSISDAIGTHCMANMSDTPAYTLHLFTRDTLE